MNLTFHGILAGVLSTSALLPQVMKSLTSKRTEDLSFWMLALMISGGLLWFSYGIRLKDKPIIIANAVILGLVIALLALKIKYG
ncbi:MAG TPA: SemiSWEET transporter [Planctomycetota bacterium]|nr:SemiSWEET transporter [Planctomycetota bacterium]